VKITLILIISELPFNRSNFIFNQCKKKIIYTCIIGNYDILRSIKSRDSNWRYICFTDQIFEAIGWEIRKIPDELIYLDNTRKARALKILPHLFLEPYDECIWIDGNIEIMGSIEKFVAEEIDRNHIFAIPKHPERICIYQEGQEVIRLKKENTSSIRNQIKKYEKEKYPRNWGLVQSQLIYRKNEESIKKLCEIWWGEILYRSQRDQMSFNYAFWKSPLHKVKLLDPRFLIDSPFFRYWHHCNPKSVPSVLNISRNYGKMSNLLNGEFI